MNGAIPMKEPIRQSERHIEAVLAALKVLDCFLMAPVLTTKQLIDMTGFTRNRVMRLTGTLLYRGYLVQVQETAAYTPGPKVLALGKVFERNNNLVQLARPILREMALKTGESISMYVRDGLERVVLAREEGTQFIRYNVSEGQRMDLHAGAGGKVLLAFAPAEVARAVIEDEHLASHTSRTITDIQKLSTELEKIRRQGFAVSMGERIQDACAIAAPVFERKDQLICALAIVGPVSRFTAASRKIFTAQILAAANKLSKALGGQVGEPIP